MGVNSRICCRHVKFEVPIQVEIMSSKVNVNIKFESGELWIPYLNLKVSASKGFSKPYKLMRSKEFM